MRIVVFACLCMSAASAVCGIEMTAGTAKAVITPRDDVPRVLVTGKKHVAVDHDLYARALVLNDGTARMVVVTYDLNCLDVATPILRVRCRDELGIPPERLILLATHNHEAPIQIVPDNFAYGRWLADRIFDLVQKAIENEQGPVRLFFGSGEGDFVIRMGAEVIDKEIQVLKVVKGDAPVAVLFNHPAHPIQATEDHIGVGHCGYALDELEARLPGCLPLYADACGGNQFAVMPFGHGIPRVQRLGRALADAAMSVLNGPMQDVTGSIRSEMAVIPLPLAPPMPREEAERLAAVMGAPLDIGLVPYPQRHRHTNWLRELLRRYREGLPFPVKTTDMVCTDDAFLVDRLPEAREFPCRYEETIVATIGPLVFVAMQGEVCAPIGLRVKNEFRNDRPIMVFAYMGEHNLYIPTRSLVEANIYQGQVIQIQYACPVRWAPEVEQEMGDAVIRMIRTAISR
ncbi:MAG TPA: hypothetical protein P5318_10490 [Candidatus Hydrogenedentes bacterium]|nr:hypothetical protein [Candidatus Hydrogenedentota bacterium]HRT20542.1 hypothetical protein [Candidatus Hydrogenedentota bacterium]HRT65253.1 hypothetical protein [Candidatus Hydrogenedentota bacterium]